MSASNIAPIRYPDVFLYAMFETLNTMFFFYLQPHICVASRATLPLPHTHTRPATLPSWSTTSLIATTLIHLW